MSSAEEQSACPTCGGALAADAPEGLCAKCIVEVMMNFAEADEGSFDDDEEVTLLTAAAQIGQVGDYEILEKIAAGGMGVVYRARQKRLGRVVALKLVAEGKLAADSDKERFLLEARAAGELDHPNIVPIYEVGEDDGQYFFSMPLVTGGSLSDWLDEQAISDGGKSGSSLGANFRDRQSAAAKLLQKIAKAVHYAHEQGILHRDLKPANILIDHHGEPQISDFGLAKRVADDSHLTISGQLLGSPAYMSPEQAQGKNHELTPAADVYAIGVMLYQALTGGIPFDGDSPMKLLQETLTKEPKPLRKCNPRIDRDLETITLCCLEKEPGDRYTSAEALAEDLDRWLDGKPIKAKSAGVVRRSVKWLRRKPAVAAAAGIAILGAALMAGMDWRHEREQAIKSLADYPEDIRLAHEHLDGGQITQASAILDKQLPGDREFAWKWLARRCASTRAVEVGRDQVHALTPSLTQSGVVLVQGPLGVVRSWDLSGNKVIEDFKAAQPPSLTEMRFDGGGTFLLTQNAEKGLRLLLPNSERKDGKLASTLVSSRGGFLAAAPGLRPSLFVQSRGQRGDSLFTWAPPWREGSPRFELSDNLQALSISPKSQQHERYYVAACFSSKIELWQWEEDVFFRKATIQRKPSPSAAMAFSPNGRLLLVGDARGMIRGLNRRSADWSDLEYQHLGAVQTMTTLNSGGVHHVVAGNEDGQLRAWPLVFERSNIASNVELPFGFSEDGDSMVFRNLKSGKLQVRSTREAASVSLGELRKSGTMIVLALLQSAPPVALAIFQDEAKRLSASRITKDGVSPALEQTLPRIRTDWLDQSVNGSHWFILGSDGEVREVDLQTGSIRAVERLSGDSRKKVRIFGGESSLLSTMEGTTITLHESSSKVRRLELATAAVASHLAVSPDHQTLAVAHEDDRLRLWHGRSGKLLLKISEHPWDYLQFSPTGETLVGYETNGNLHFFDTQMTP
ncbi:MAG: protein kinase [Verrucomicrobiaceae bacterium]|nr:protein kinase [Verrucomicrobiaceae bacterium]